MKIFPLNDQIAVEVAEPADTTEGGIHIPLDAREVPQTGTVIAISLERINKYPRVGDRVLFPKYSGIPFNANGKNILMLSGEEILAVLQDES